MADSTGNSVVVWVACMLVLVQLVAHCQVYNPRKLCGDKKIKLHSIYDVVHTSTEGCHTNVKVAYEALNNMVYFDSPCAMSKAKAITHFAEKYLKGWYETPNDGPTLPKAAKKFAIAYGMLASSACRWLLVKELYPTAEKRLQKSDFEALSEWTGDNGPIARILDPISKQAEFILPSDFSALLPEFEGKYKVAIKLEHSEKIVKAQEVCEKRFRPLYKNIVLPLAHLARNGFRYNRFYVANGLALSQTARNRNALWSRIVFLCESLKEFEVTKTSEGSLPGSIDAKAGEENGRKRVDPDTSTDLEEVNDYYGETRISLPSMNQGYEPTQYRLHDSRLISPFDLRLKGAVRSFNASLSETDRFRKKLLGNKWSLLMSAFRSDESTIDLFKRALKTVVSKIGDKQDEQLQLVERDLFSMLESNKKSKFIKAISKMVHGGLRVVRLLGRILELTLVIILITKLIFVYSLRALFWRSDEFWNHFLDEGWGPIIKYFSRRML